MKNNAYGKNTTHSDRDGFSMVETLVAITILLVAIAAPMRIAQDGLSGARVAQDQVIASYLAQEAVEYVRWVRDTNTLEGDGWLSGLSACRNNECVIDVIAEEVDGCDGECPSLQINGNGQYGYGPGGQWENTPFVRTVEINDVTENDPDTEVQVVVTVEWQTKDVDRSFVTREFMFNWQ